MIHTTISKGNRVYLVGDFESADLANLEAELAAGRRGWFEHEYKKHFENVEDLSDDEEVISL